MTKWNDAAPNYLMVDIVMKNKSGEAYDPQPNVWVIVYGSKGYRNDLPARDVWDNWY